MRIDRIAIERKINTGNYDNTTWRLEAQLEPGESPELTSRLLNLHLAVLVREEWERRYPDPGERRWHQWLEPAEIEPEQPQGEMAPEDAAT